MLIMMISIGLVAAIETVLLIGVLRNQADLQMTISRLNRDIDAVRPGNYLQLTTLTSIDNELLSLGQRQREHHLVLIFATIDCPACRQLVEALSRVVGQLGHPIDQVCIFCIDERNRVEQWREDINIPRSVPIVAMAEREVEQLCTLRVVPTVVFVGRHGRVDDVFEGAFSEGNWREVLERNQARSAQILV